MFSILGEIKDYLKYDLTKVRVKYLDREDIESLGLKKASKNQWIGWEDYYLEKISGEYGYFLYATLHFPRLYNKSNRVTDNHFKIILHRHYNDSLDETTNIDDKLKENESEIVYIGSIKNKFEANKLLKQLNITYEV